MNHSWLAGVYKYIGLLLTLLPLCALAQEFAIEGPVKVDWSETISVDAGNDGVQGLRDWPGANRVVTSADGAEVYSFVNGRYSYDEMSLHARNAETGAVLWQVTPCPEVDWHNYNVCMIDDMELADTGDILFVAGRKEVSTELNVAGNRTDQAWVAAFATATGNLLWQQTTDFGGQIEEPRLDVSYIDLSDDLVLLASSIRAKHLSGSIKIGAFAALDRLAGTEQWSTRVGTHFNDEFEPTETVLSMDQSIWYVGGIADAEVWPCDTEGVCGPHPTVTNYTNAFGLVSIDVSSGALTDLSERSLPENKYSDAKAFGLTLSDNGQYLYQVGTAVFQQEHADWSGLFYSTRMLIRHAAPTGNYPVAHDVVHSTFPTSLFYWGEEPEFEEEFNSCNHGQVAAGADQLYWHFECSNTQTGEQGSVLKALDRDTWALSWQSIQYSDEEWADDLMVLPDGQVLASGGTWDDATDQLNGFVRAIEAGTGEQTYQVQYQAYENPASAGKERIHDVASGGDRVLGRVSMGNASFDHYQLFALSPLEVATNDDFHLRCLHEPLWPQAGDSVKIRTAPKRFPLDGNPYHVDRREIWLDVSSQPVVFNEGTPPYELSYETAPLTEGQQFSYGCRALDGENSVFSGWRTVTVGTPGPSDAIPVAYTGPSSDRIDIVLIADGDTYLGPDDPEFLEDAGIMYKYLFENEFFTKYQHLFNFWIAQTTAAADSYDNEEGKFTTTITKPNDWETNYAFADAGVIIHQDDFRDFAKGGFFTSTRGFSGVARHEVGHRPFGLADEYCCDGGYYEQSVFPNVYETLEACEDDAPNLGRNTAACRSWVSDYSDLTYYTSEPASDDLMKDNKTPQAADIRRIEWLLEKCLEGEC